MSTEERERELGRRVLRLRDKELKQRCLQDKAYGLEDV